MKRNNSRMLFFAIAFSFFMAVWTQGFAAEKAPFIRARLETSSSTLPPAADGYRIKNFCQHLTKHIPDSPLLPCKIWEEVEDSLP